MSLYGLQDGTDAVVKEVLPGDSVHSLLSILDIITVCLCLCHLYTRILKQIPKFRRILICVTQHNIQLDRVVIE